MKKMTIFALLLGLLIFGGLFSNDTFVADPDHPKIASITFDKR
jgi:hypothetical protein